MELGSEITKLTNGLEKLREAAETSEALSKELSVSQLELNRKAKDCEDLMIRLETDNREAQDKSKEVELRSAAVAKESADIKSLEADAQADLEKAEPALHAAEEGLKNLD